MRECILAVFVDTREKSEHEVSRRVWNLINVTEIDLKNLKDAVFPRESERREFQIYGNF